jgi:hypothetical protein
MAGIPVPGTPSSAPSADVLWKQYKLHVDLYKEYLELVLKFNVFYYAVTGAILSFYFTNKTDIGRARPLLLLFPASMSIAFGAFFLYGASLVKVARSEVASIAAALGLHVFPEVQVLAVLLRVTALLFLLIAVGLLVLFGFAMCRQG